MILQCTGCKARLKSNETEVQLGDRFRFHPPCGVQGRCEVIALEPTDDLIQWRNMLYRSAERLTRLLELDAPDLIINEERRMLIERAEVLCLFERIPVPQNTIQ